MSEIRAGETIGDGEQSAPEWAGEPPAVDAVDPLLEGMPSLPPQRRRVGVVYVDGRTGRVTLEDLPKDGSFDDLRLLVDTTAALHAGFERQLTERLVEHHAPRMAVAQLVSESLGDVVLPLVRAEVAKAMNHASAVAAVRSGQGSGIVLPGRPLPGRRKG